MNFWGARMNITELLPMERKFTLELTLAEAKAMRAVFGSMSRDQSDNDADYEVVCDAYTTLHDAIYPDGQDD